jgi:hypothetical protein
MDALTLSSEEDLPRLAKRGLAPPSSLWVILCKSFSSNPTSLKSISSHKPISGTRAESFRLLETTFVCVCTNDKGRLCTLCQLLVPIKAVPHLLREASSTGGIRFQTCPQVSETGAKANRRSFGLFLRPRFESVITPLTVISVGTFMTAIVSVVGRGVGMIILVYSRNRVWPSINSLGF